MTIPFLMTSWSPLAEKVVTTNLSQVSWLFDSNLNDRQICSPQSVAELSQEGQ